LLSLLGSKVFVQQPGGQLEIDCKPDFQTILLTGPAVSVYQGQLK